MGASVRGSGIRMGTCLLVNSVQGQLLPNRVSVVQAVVHACRH